MSPLNSISKHAITPLAFDKLKIHRERLVDLMHASLPRKLIAIIAPAGYGKSTLLADFTAHTEFPVCWVRLSEADQDVMRLANLLAASLQKRFRRLRGQPNLEVLTNAPPEAIARAFVDLIDAKVDDPFVIALDDVQWINPSQPSMAFIDALIREMPPYVTLVIAGRELPELSLAKLVVDGDMTGISMHDLAFNREELTSFTEKQVSGAVSEGEIDTLLEETHGWISAVILSTHLLSMNSGMPGKDPMVYEYLASEVFNHQPDDLRQFMLDSSVMPLMSAESCDHVLEREDSQRHLTGLVRRGLFVTATELTPRTYEYHPLFRRFLCDTLGEKDTRRLRSLQSRAAAYLSEHGSPEDAIDLYFEVGADEHAAALIDEHAPRMHEMGRTQTLEAWADRLRGTGAAAPKLFLHIACAHIDTGDLDAADKALQTTFEVLERVKVSNAIKVRARNVQGFLALQRGRYGEVLQSVAEAERLLTTRSSRLRRATCLRLKARAIHGSGGDIEESESLLKQAVKLLEKTDDRYTLAAALQDLALIQEALGMPLEAQATSLRAHEILEQIGAPLLLAISFNNLAFIAHLEGRYEQALFLFNEGLQCAHRAASRRLVVPILYGQADLFCDLGLPHQAAELYDRALRLAIQMDHPGLINYGYIQTAALHRRSGTAGLPLEWLNRAAKSDQPDEEPVNVAIQRAAIDTKDMPGKAIQRLLALLDGPETALQSHQRTLTLYFFSAAMLHRGEKDRAKRYLEEALTWASSRGTGQILAGELMYDRSMLRFGKQYLPEHPVMRDLIQRVELMESVARSYQKSLPEGKAPTRLELIAFGASEVRYEGQRITDLEPRPRQLLFFLADRGQVERDEILEAFWRDTLVGRQVSSLYTAIHSLRRATCDEIIQMDGSIYTLNAEYMTNYDVGNFERAARVAESMLPGDPRRFFALTEVIHAYAGDFLPEFAADWVLERRESLEARYLNLLTTHAEESLARGQPLKAFESLHQALKIAPLRDDINMRYLELLGELNRRSEAIGHYQKYVRLLTDELGLDPPEAMRELYTRLIS
jgi:DNA-binding SARP family transcriptional activator